MLGRRLRGSERGACSVVAVDSSVTIVSQLPTVEYIGGTKTQNVIAVGFTTNAHGVYAEARVGASVYDAHAARAAAIGVATIIETLFTIPGVSGVVWGQATNDSGLLVDQATIFVSSDSENSTGQIGPLAISQLGPQLHTPQISALREQLNAAEGNTAS